MPTSYGSNPNPNPNSASVMGMDLACACVSYEDDGCYTVSDGCYKGVVTQSVTGVTRGSLHFFYIIVLIMHPDLQHEGVRA
jgi:hypothetical protein